MCQALCSLWEQNSESEVDLPVRNSQATSFSSFFVNFVH